MTFAENLCLASAMGLSFGIVGCTFYYLIIRWDRKMNERGR